MKPGLSSYSLVIKTMTAVIGALIVRPSNICIRPLKIKPKRPSCRYIYSWQATDQPGKTLTTNYASTSQFLSPQSPH